LAWIGERAQKQGKKISPEAARVLQEITGSNLRLLAGEIEKIATFVGERPAIGEADVLVLAAAGETSAFSLMDALREKNLKKALILFQALLRNREDVFSLLALMASQYRLMLQIKSLSGRESDPNRVARLVGGSPYYVRKCSAGLGRFTLAELKNDLSLLLLAGQKLKTGEQQAAALELLMIDLCQPAASRN
ncbi:MAG: DNA polymerase III subunit delta, partial [Candidatus Margulisbacteria bacterium]|nr:DNA polymerase III subunit delta [Candidatus Margulisiibacteriota bacterium]